MDRAEGEAVPVGVRTEVERQRREVGSPEGRVVQLRALRSWMGEVAIRKAAKKKKDTVPLAEEEPDVEGDARTNLARCDSSRNGYYGL
ncbi:hypothetical protein NDU88_008975 [Pleurodeles waltl]|uniref:Uncharacterized protein n=1 Tax=Pleurodeles waltl TaxID=8319 RepID=A0AAV7RXA2_PLEWA|nr:hypothetical protein NDU88_008975 [Pleurodeles waltl]